MPTPDQTLLISIGTNQAVSGTLIIVGAIIAAAWRTAWYSSGKFSRIETSIEGLNIRLTNIEAKSSGAVQAQSPISLTDSGREALLASGLKKYIDEQKEKFFEDCQASRPLQTAYDVQKAAFDYFDHHEYPNDLEKAMKETAFQQGISLEVLKRIAGIYFRDVCLEKLNMELPEANSSENNYSS